MFAFVVIFRVGHSFHENIKNEADKIYVHALEEVYFVVRS